jgi:integrase
MPKIAKILNDLQCKRLTRPGWHAVGGVAGLLLQVNKSQQEGGLPPRSWIFRYTLAGKREVIGLGPYPQIPLSTARDVARQLSLDIRAGINPVVQKRVDRSALIAQNSKQRTFQKCAVDYIDAHASDYTNEKHRKQWASTFETYAYPIIGQLMVADVGMRHVLEVLLQKTTHRDKTVGKFWYIKPETAKRLLDRIRTVLDYATVNEYRAGNNPAIWKGYLDKRLPAPRGLKNVKHHPAVPYQEIGDFIKHLRQFNSMSAKALEFVIITGVRSGSVRLSQWSEIDWTRKLWIIPPDHTKTKEEHRVPLPVQAINLLKSIPQLAGVDVIFPNKAGKPLSDMALSQLMRGMYENGSLRSLAVPHGFRSTFRDWAADCTNYADEIRKAASGHAVGDAVKKAYQRTDLLAKRRNLMDDWAKFLDKPSQFAQASGIILPINRGRR